MKVLVSEKEIERLKSSKPMGQGKEGTCYFQGNGSKIIKLFYEKELERHNEISFTNMYHEQIAFPIDVLINEKGETIGYTMNYLSGIKIINGLNDSLSIEDLKKAYFNMRIIILKLKNIYMEDNCLENMLYDYQKNRINLIDTSRWYEKLDGQIGSINNFNRQLITALINSIDFKHHKLNHDKRLFEMYLDYRKTEDVLSLFIEFLNEIEKKVSEYKGEKVKTIGELKV